MIAYCGIDCSKCSSYLATQSGNEKELANVAKALSKRYNTEVKPDYVICDGCKAEKRHSYFCSNLCKMRLCCIEQGFDSCRSCQEFPCEDLQSELDHSLNAKDNLEKMLRKA